jgi:hypothetical protein
LAELVESEAEFVEEVDIVECIAVIFGVLPIYICDGQKTRFASVIWRAHYIGNIHYIHNPGVRVFFTSHMNVIM